MKKGFTLIELLAVIVILAIIVVIAVPRVLKVVNDVRESAYVSNTKLIEKAAANYLTLNVSRMPIEIGDVSIITLSELQSNNFIGIIKDSKDQTKQCNGYVVVKKINSSEYDYTPGMKCDVNYQTTGYVQQALSSVEVLVVAGGGSGGSSAASLGGGGGGGAGGLIYNSSFSITPGVSNTVTVGNGGAGKTHTPSKVGDNGQNSIFGALIAIGGGGGGSGAGTNGLVGGSGGGAGYAGYTYVTGPNGTVGQGNKGGNVLGNNNGAGGGGAGGAGGNTTDTGGVAGGSEGIGGIGLNLSISGTSKTYSQGGRGGGGGALCGQSGEANTGNGGNGVYSTYCEITGAGGSGIVIVRYPGIQRANGGTVTTVNGYTIHTFTSGTSTFTVLPF